MITVSIDINGRPIHARSARNIGTNSRGVTEYLVDDGQVIKHSRDEGAIVLAKKMLDTIKEV